MMEKHQRVYNDNAECIKLGNKTLFYNPEKVDEWFTFDR